MVSKLTLIDKYSKSKRKYSVELFIFDFEYLLIKVMMNWNYFENLFITMCYYGYVKTLKKQ